MADGIVHPRTVLDCVLHLQHHGTTPAQRQLEQMEPDLADYLLETLTAIHHCLFNLHAPAAKTRKVYRQVEVLRVGPPATDESRRAKISSTICYRRKGSVTHPPFLRKPQVHRQLAFTAGDSAQGPRICRKVFATGPRPPGCPLQP